MNLQDRTNEELDKMAAEMMGWTYHDKPAIRRLDKPLKAQLRPIWITRAEGTRFINEIMECGKWNPTHPDSNQCERYLFPKFKNLAKIRISYDMFEIHINGTEVNESYQLTDDPDQINRVKVIAALEAWRTINE